MSELRRWSEEGATDVELSLLKASRHEQAPAQARARTFKALGIALGVSTLTAATAAATGRGAGLLLKLLSVSLVGAGLVVGGWAVQRARRAPQAPVTVSQPRTPPGSKELSRAAAMAATPEAASAAITAPDPAPQVVADKLPRAPRSEASAGRLSREVAALELAHRALAAGDTGSALRLLDRYRAEFPGGSLGSEATVLRVQALLAGGNRSAAQALADSYASAHPDSPYARRIQDILHNGR